MWQKKPSAEPIRETFECPACQLNLCSVTGSGGVTLDYDIAQWQKRCSATRAGTPCVCPQFRPHLWKMLVRANQTAKGC